MKNRINKILEEYTSTKVSEDVQNDFYAWLIDEDNKEEKEKGLKQLWDDTPQEADHSTLSSWNKFKSNTREKRRKSSLLRWKSIAAIFIFISSGLLYVLIKHSANTETTDLIELYTQIAEVDSLYLPDGSVVYLNSTTTILYPEEFNGKTRSVYLIGEAAFNVRKNPNKPFIVKTSDCNITALGTHFNVEAYPNEKSITATLLSGSIAVDNLKEEKRTILEPSQQYIYDKSTARFSVSNVDLSTITSWQHGVLTIQNKTLKEVLYILERRYPINFQYSLDLIQTTDKYNFKFNMDAPLEEVLSVIQTVSGVNYFLHDNICYLK